MNIFRRIANYLATEDHDDDAWSVGVATGGFRFKSPKTGVSHRVYPTYGAALRAMEEDKSYFRKLDAASERWRLEREAAENDFSELQEEEP